MIDLGPNPLAWLRENVPPSSLRRTRPSRRAGMQRKWNASSRASRPRRGVCLSSGVVRDIGAAVTWLNNIWRIAGTGGWRRYLTARAGARLTASRLSGQAGAGLSRLSRRLAPPALEGLAAPGLGVTTRSASEGQRLLRDELAVYCGQVVIVGS